MSNETLFILKEIRDDLKQHAAQDDIIMTKVSDRLAEQSAILSDIRKDLNIHIAGVQTAREMIAADRIRLDLLEAPKKAKQHLTNYLLETSKLASAILALFGLWKIVSPYIGKLF